ncbi:MAG: SMI1/KNR4 family protein [Planctomycetaceae bacterium]
MGRILPDPGDDSRQSHASYECLGCLETESAWQSSNPSGGSTAGTSHRRAVRQFDAVPTTGKDTMIDIPRLQKLLLKVPHPPEDRLPEGASDDECNAFVKRTGIRLPCDMANWLKLANGPCVGPGGLYGIQPARSHLNIEAYLEMFPSFMTNKWLPVAGDGCGNIYVIPTQQDFGDGFPVVFVDTSSSHVTPSYIVASDIAHFLVAILECELGVQGWPFNEKHVLQSDPQIRKFSGVALPWESD